MSAIAQKWAYTQKLGNPTAKSVLAFLASHNFSDNQSFFRIGTIASATDLTIRCVQTALKFLYENGYIKKESRYAPSGQQLSNVYTLNIPKEYIEKFCEDYGHVQKDENPVDKSVDNSIGGVHHMQGGGAPCAGRGVNKVHPLNSNSENNNINKSFYAFQDQKKNKPVDNSTAVLKTSPPDNSKKHDWAIPKESGFSDTTKQSTSYVPLPEKSKGDPNGEGYQSFINSISSLRRKYHPDQTMITSDTCVQSLPSP